MVSMFRMEVGEVESCRAEEHSHKLASKAPIALTLDISPRSFSKVAPTIPFFHRRLRSDLSSEISQLRVSKASTEWG